MYGIDPKPSLPSSQRHKFMVFTPTITPFLSKEWYSPQPLPALLSKAHGIHPNLHSVLLKGIILWYSLQPSPLSSQRYNFMVFTPTITPFLSKEWYSPQPSVSSCQRHGSHPNHYPHSSERSFPDQGLLALNNTYYEHSFPLCRRNQHHTGKSEKKT